MRIPTQIMRLLVSILLTGVSVLAFAARADQACVGLFSEKAAVRPINLFRAYPDQRKIVDDLMRGQISNPRPFKNSYGNSSQLFLVDVHNPATGQTRTALFKPRTYVDTTGPWTDRFQMSRTNYDVLAYRFSLFFGMDIVPPTVWRNHVEIPGAHSTEGALMSFVEDLRVAASERTEHGLKFPNPRHDPRLVKLLADDYVLAILLQNADRTDAQFGIGKHWTTGQDVGVSYDWSASLRERYNVRYGLTDFYYYRWPERDAVRRETAERVLNATEDQINEVIGSYADSERDRETIIQSWKYLVNVFEARKKREERLKLNGRAPEPLFVDEVKPPSP